MPEATTPSAIRVAKILVAFMPLSRMYFMGAELGKQQLQQHWQQQKIHRLHVSYAGISRRMQLWTCSWR